MKKGWAGTFAVLVLGATVLTGCGSTSDSGHIKLKIATVGNEKHQSTMAAAAFQEKLEELAGDRFEVTITRARSWAVSDEWTEGVIGDQYPVPDRILKYTEVLVEDT